MTYRVLSLDGGGIKDLITVIMLQCLSQEPGLNGWLEKVDLIAGTSTGGLIALALAKGLDLQAIRDLYEKKGRDIFDDTWVDDLVDLGKIIGADYHATGLTRELKNQLGSATLGQLKRSVLITTFDLDNEDPDPKRRTWKPKLFHNIPGQSNDNQWLAYKVGMYTSAAPTFFPAVDGYIDGGVYATNQSMCALAQTQDRRNAVHVPLADVVLLSLGTGKSLTYIKKKDLDWGYAQWAQPLVSLMLDGVDGVADYQCKQILGDCYFRLAPQFPPGISMEMDDVERMPEMVAFANSVRLDDTVAWIKACWM